METYKDKLGQATALFAEIKTILANPASTTEDKNKIEPMLADARRLKVEAGQLKDIESFGAELATAAEQKQEVLRAATTPTPGQFKDWGEYLQATHNACNPQYKGNPDPRLRYFKDEAAPGEQKQMVEGTGASGGFLVPTEFNAQLQAVVGESSIVRQRATVIRMARRALQIPVLDQTGSTAGIPHWFGGMQFYWEDEAGLKTVTDAHFRQIQLVAHKLIGYTRASDELVEDSAISLADFLSGPLGMAGGIVWMEDYAFLQGSGAGQPLGVINAGATIVEPRFAAGTISYDDLADMMQDFLPTGKGVWVVTQSAMSTMIQLTGPAADPSYVWQPNARDGMPQSILGFPVIWTEKLPLLGTQGDILLADFRYYLVGDRQATTLESTQYDYWRYDQTSWRAVHRVDGQPWLSQPLTYQDGTTRISPFVILGGGAAGS